MREALMFQNDKSNKFWRVETSGTFMVTNWGKTGTNGRLQLTEFDSEEECEREAKKLVSSKKKKGYEVLLDFDYNERVYFDCDEYGPHPLTSHPAFREYFSNDLYYDCGDEEAPFGSDEGSDTLAFLQEQYSPKLDFANFPQKLIERDWGMTYLVPDDMQSDKQLKEQAGQEIDGLSGEQQILMSDQIILATTFGQIKMTGKLSRELLKLAYSSLNRWERLYHLLWDWTEEKPPYNILAMRSDLTCFEEKCPERIV